MTPLGSEDINPALRRAREEAQAERPEHELTFEVVVHHRAGEGEPSPSTDDMYNAIKDGLDQSFDLLAIEVHQR